MDFCPLISLKSCGHNNYFLWIEEGAADAHSLSLKVTDGYKVWEQSVEAGSHKPKSRKESDMEYIELILNCLRDIDTEKRDYGISITATGSLQFMIKERLGSMMALLLKLNMTENYDAATSIRGILAGACNTCASSTTLLSNATKEIQLQREANDTLCQTIQSYSASKEEFQNDFFKKFTILLNSKKREVRRLQEEVSALEEEITTLRAKTKKSLTSIKKKSKPAAKSKSKKSKVQQSDESDIVNDDEEEVQSEGSESNGDGDDYSLHSEDENTSQGSDNASDDDLPSDSQSTNTSTNANRKRKPPPSYTQQPTKTLLKKRNQKGSGSQSSTQSQFVSQVLFPASGSTETSGSDLTRILSQSKKRRKVIKETQEEEEEIEEHEIERAASSKGENKYAYDDEDVSEEEFEGDTRIDGDTINDMKVGGNAGKDVVAKKKKSAFDKLYNNDSSSSEEEGNLMDFM